MSRSTRPTDLIVVQEPRPAAYPSIPQQYAGGGVSGRQLAAILLSYWRVSAAIAAGVLAVTVLVLLIIPKAYTARATLIYEYDNRDPLAGEQVPLGMIQAYVATQTELMTSPVVLNTVVQRLKLTADPAYARGFRGDAGALKDFVEKKLSAAVQVEEGRGGQLLYITATDSKPERAAEIANTVASVYLDLDQKRLSDPAAERARRYSEQLAELRAKVAAAQAKVTDFRQRNGLTEVTAAATDADALGLAELQKGLIDAQNTRRAAEAQVSGDRSASNEALASRSVEALKTQLEARESELAQLGRTLGPQHPKILELQAQVDSIRRSLAAEMQTLAQNSAQRVRSTREVEGKYAGALSEQRQKLLATRQLQDEGGKLLLELESAQSVYKRALDGYDQIMFASNGAHRNVSLVDRAIAPARPSKPSRLKLFAVGVAAALFFALAGPLLYELILNRRVRHRDDLERDLGIPVLAELGGPRALRKLS